MLQSDHFWSSRQSDHFWSCAWSNLSTLFRSGLPNISDATVCKVSVAPRAMWPYLLLRSSKCSAALAAAPRLLLHRACCCMALVAMHLLLGCN